MSRNALLPKMVNEVCLPIASWVEVGPIRFHVGVDAQVACCKQIKSRKLNLDLSRASPLVSIKSSTTLTSCRVARGWITDSGGFFHSTITSLPFSVHPKNQILKTLFTITFFLFHNLNLSHFLF